MSLPNKIQRSEQWKQHTFILPKFFGGCEQDIQVLGYLPSHCPCSWRKNGERGRERKNKERQGVKRDQGEAEINRHAGNSFVYL